MTLNDTLDMTSSQSEILIDLLANDRFHTAPPTTTDPPNPYSDLPTNCNGATANLEKMGYVIILCALNQKRVMGRREVST